MSKVGKNSSRSTIALSIVSGQTYLNDCLTPQYRWVDFSINDPDGAQLARVSLSLDQFAHFLVSNQETPCTMTRYRDKDGQSAKEKVSPPESVQARLTDNIGTSGAELAARIADIEKDVYEMVNGGARGKKAMEQLLHDVKVLKSHYTENLPYMLSKAQEEAAKIQNNMRAQLSTVLSVGGAEVTEELLRRLEAQPSDVALLTAGEAPASVSGYEKKERDSKATSLLTSLEIADRISQHLKRIEGLAAAAAEATSEKPDGGERGSTRLYWANATPDGPKHVGILYVSYQGRSKVEIEMARSYLEFLRTVDTLEKFETHHGFKKAKK